MVVTLFAILLLASLSGCSDDATTDPPASGGCALPAYPDETCTGVPPDTALTVVEGDLVVDTPNTVIDAQEIHGVVEIRAPGVVIRRSKLKGVRSFAGAYSGDAVVVEDSELDCGSEVGSTAIGDTSFTVRRVNIHGCENGFDVDGDVTIEDSYIHDLLPYDPETDPHTDGIQITPVGHDIVIRHNTLFVPGGTSALISPNVSAGVISNVLVQDNLVAGGAYTIYCPQEGSGDDFRLIDNHFSTVFSPKVGEYGPWTDCEGEVEVSGNVFHETGVAVPF